jgi:hypothetical protein
VALIYQIIPLIDRFTELFEKMIVDKSLHLAMRHAAKIALAVLNKYYSYTDNCEVYRIAMCKSFVCFIFVNMPNDCISTSSSF